MLQLYLLYYNSSFLVTIINIKRRKIFLQLLTKKMHNLDKVAYLLCIFVILTLGFSSVNNIKKDLLKQSNQINEAVTSYSQYLQTLNY